MTSLTLTCGQSLYRQRLPPSARLGKSFERQLSDRRSADHTFSATKQLILLPGNNWTSAETFVSNGSADALNKVTNPDGSIDGLIFDVHKYLDSDNSYVPRYSS